MDQRKMKSFNTSRCWVVILLAIPLLLSLLFFHTLIRPDSVLFHTDSNVGINVMIKQHLPDAFLGFWNDSVLLGTKDIFALTVNNALLWVFPAHCFTNWIHAIYLTGASFFLLLYFRAKGLSVHSGLIGMLAAFWLASTFTLVYPGHHGKFGNIFFAAIVLWCIAGAVKGSRPTAWALLAGGALGQMFVEQQDMAFFFACVLGPYALFAVWNEYGWNWKAGTRIIMPLIIVAALFAVPAAWVGYNTAVRGVASMERENDAEKWDFCTQWSWPPEESIDFIAPGYMGWRSGEPAGPYWGRMGRSAGWEQTRQGFQNFKLENQYLGAIPLALALFAVLMAALMRGDVREYGSNGIRKCRSKNVQEKKNSEMQSCSDTPICPHPDTPTHPHTLTFTRAEIIFWGCTALVTLLLAFGKYFPLYYFFYQLPVVSSIRNPNKFLQVFQLAVAILAAYGFDLAIGARANETLEKQGK